MKWILVHEKAVQCLTCYSCDACGNHKNSWGSVTGSDGSACFVSDFTRFFQFSPSNKDYFLFPLKKYVYKDKPISYTNRGVRSSCSPGSDGGAGNTYCCSTDYCNGSVTLVSSIGLIFALFVSVCILRRMFLLK